MERPCFTKLNFDDNVGIALDDLTIGNTAVDVADLSTGVANGHKFTLMPVKKGRLVHCYRQVIGAASEDIPSGVHVHVHILSIADQALD